MSHEEFDPLRIRPYVRLPDPEPDPADEVVGAAYTTAPLPAVTVSEPAAAPAPPPPPPRRRRPFTVIGGGVAAVAVLGTAAFAGGLFSAGDSVRDKSLPAPATSAPDEPVPSPATSSASATPSASPSTARPSRSAASSASPSPTPSLHAPATAAAPTPSRSTVTARATAEAGQPGARSSDAPVLRRGDSGPGVVELQQRMNQVYVYREAPDGQYDQDVEDAVRRYQSWTGIRSDPPGVYGPETRRSLEAATHTPRR